ncbi:MAG: PAS domain-containing protein [Bacteroidetes bacterium]|nr:MAG: PAS domain-containing protein [Bacteroidota bacterium]
MPDRLEIAKATLELFDSTRDGVVLFNLNGTIVYANKSISSILELHPSEIINKSCDSFISDPQIKFDHILNTLSTQQCFIQEVKCKKSNGETVELTFSLSFLNSPEGLQKGVLLVIKDRFLEFQDEKDFLSQQNNLLRSLNFRQEEICLLYDYKNFRSLYCSESIQQILGWTASEYVNGGWAFSLSITHPEDAHKLEKQFTSEMAMRKHASANLDSIPVKLKYRKRHKNGDYIWVQSDTWILDRDSNGSINHLLIFMKNITVEKEGDLAMQNPKILELLINGLENLTMNNGDKVTNGIAVNEYHLSSREKEILAMIKKGLSTKEISAKLSLTVNTVNTYRKNLMNKLKAKNSAELVRIAIEEHII